jgi:uncharacterized membrane protein
MAFVAELSANHSRPFRRWTVLGSGVLCGLLALVVIYTKPRAFHSPIAVVVVSAIGLAALLLQTNLYNSQQQTEPLRAPTWLNILGILCAMLAVFADVLRFPAQLALALAFGAIGAFSISAAIIMHALRKRRVESK